MKIYGYGIIGTGRGLSCVGVGALEYDTRIVELIEFREQYMKLPDTVTAALFFRPVFVRNQPPMMLISRLHRSADAAGRRGFVGGCFLTELVENYEDLFAELSSDVWVNAISGAGAILRDGKSLPLSLLDDVDTDLTLLANPASLNFHIGKQDSEFFMLEPGNGDSIALASCYAWAKTVGKESVQTFIFVEKGSSRLNLLNTEKVRQLYTSVRATQRAQPKPEIVRTTNLPPLDDDDEGGTHVQETDLQPQRQSAFFNAERELRLLRAEHNKLARSHEEFRKESVLVASLLTAFIFLLFILYAMDKVFF